MRRHGFRQLLQHLPALLGRQLLERLLVRLLDCLRRSGAHQVAIPLDRLLVRRRSAIARRRAAQFLAPFLGLALVPSTEKSTKKAHGLTPIVVLGTFLSVLMGPQEPFRAELALYAVSLCSAETPSMVP